MPKDAQKAVQRKVQTMASKARIVDPTLLLVSEGRAHAQMVALMRLDNWQVSASQALVALWASRAPSESPGSLASTAASVPLLDQAISSSLCRLLSDQAAVKAIATPAFVRDNAVPDAFLPGDVTPVLGGFACVVDDGVACTAAIVAAFVQDTFAVLADKAKELQAMFPKDLGFMLAPSANGATRGS